MLPGKKYTVDDVLDILRRRYWFILVPMALVGATAAWYQRTLLDEYSSSAVILIVPQKIPENVVQATVDSNVEQRVQSLRTTVLSRTRLERMIEEFNLYPDMRRDRPMDDVIDHIRDHINAYPIGGNSFQVGFEGGDPALVTKVTEHLAQLFINESSIDRQAQVQDTSQFLDAEVARALDRLREAERRLSTWKQTHAGQLPNQLDANLAEMQNTQAQLSDLRGTMNQDRARRLELERQLADLQDPSRAVAALNATQAQGTAGGPSTIEQQLLVAEAQLNTYEQRGLRPGHPDLDAARRRVNDLRTRLERESATGRSEGQATTAQTVEALRARRVDELKVTVASIDKQLAQNQDEEKRLMAANADVQRRVDAMPARESEEIELRRDYDILRGAYEDLLQDKTRAQLSSNLERRQAGEQFRLTDPARLPEEPDGPNRPRAVLTGLVTGFVIGVAFVGLLEFRDRGFKTDEDLAALLDLPVLAVVPVMKSDADVRRLFWRRLGLSTGLGSVVAAGMVFVVYALLQG